MKDKKGRTIRKIRPVAYGPGFTTEFPAVKIGADETAESVARRVAEALRGVTYDDDDAFFAYAEVAGAFGDDMGDWEPRRNLLLNVGYADLTKAEKPFRVVGTTAVVNVSARTLAIECLDENGTRSGYEIAPGEAALIVCGTVAYPEAVAKEGADERGVAFVFPFEHRFKWRDAVTHEQGVMYETKFARAVVERAKPDEFVEAARICGVPYYGRGGKLYRALTVGCAERAKEVRHWRGSSSHVRKTLAFRDAATNAAREGRSLETYDVQKERSDAERAAMAEWRGIVEVEGSYFREAKPGYVIWSDDGRTYLEFGDGHEIRRGSEDYETFRLTEREAALTKAKAIAAKRSTTFVDYAPDAEDVEVLEPSLFA